MNIESKLKEDFNKRYYYKHFKELFTYFKPHNEVKINEWYQKREETFKRFVKLYYGDFYE